MSRKYKVKSSQHPYFVTFAVVGWIDLFTRAKYMEQLVSSLAFCQKKKGLLLYAWVFMTNHVHMIVGSNRLPLENIMRDFKSFTSRALRKELEMSYKESRRHWLIPAFKAAGNQTSNTKDWQLWQQGFHPIELSNAAICDQKFYYLHNNPVRAQIVRNPEDYVWSSAADYAGFRGPLQIEFL